MKAVVRLSCDERIGLNAVANAVDGMFGPLASVRSLIDPRKQ
jgi:hypothetical protein